MTSNLGRPATPGSVAGVARRQARRSYGYGAVGASAVGAAIVGTAAAAAGSYYGGPGYYSDGPYYARPGYYGGLYYGGPAVQTYADPNGFTCQPGSMITLADGRTYPCQ